jgi:hypothetical protein
MASVQDGETIDTLGAMFSNLDREVITKVLRSCGGNADRAIEKLLTVSDNPAALDSIQVLERSSNWNNNFRKLEKLIILLVCNYVNNDILIIEIVIIEKSNL